MSYDSTTKEFIRFASYVGMVCERASRKLENTSKYNDTRKDVFDGYFDACINATDIVWFGGVFSESDIIDEIDMANSMHTIYAKTTNYHDETYYRVYRACMKRFLRAYRLIYFC